VGLFRAGLLEACGPGGGAGRAALLAKSCEQQCGAGWRAALGCSLALRSRCASAAQAAPSPA
jgi:hypothetical protein